MNDDRLRLDLADLADEVTPVDLRDRALRTSRRLGIQRAIATSAAAVVMVGAATGTAFALMPRNGDNAPMPADTSSVTITPTPVEVTPTPTSEPSATASAVVPETQPGRKPAALDGTRYYFDTTSKDAVIHAVRDGSDEVVARIPLGADECVGNSITVSPDGKRLAWVQDGDVDGMNGTLMTSSIDGSRKRKLLTGVVCIGSNPLVWQGGDLMMVQQGNRSVLMNMAAGKPGEGDPGQETNRVWSADGKYLAATDSDGGNPYVGGDGVIHVYHYDPPKTEAAKYDGWRARSVSMDGRYVSIGWVGTDPSRRDDSFVVVDTTNSKVVQLPTSGEIKSIQFASDGKVLVRQATRIVVLDARFRQAGEVAEPRDVRSLTLLAYVP